MVEGLRNYDIKQAVEASEANNAARVNEGGAWNRVSKEGQTF